MRTRLPAIVAMALLVGLTVPAVTGARSAQSAAQAEHTRILAYWTPERVAHAQPREMVRTSVGFAPAPAKGKPGPGGGAVTGASWSGNGIIEQRSGRVLFHNSSGDWICSGSVMSENDSAHSVVLTAGHCVYDSSAGWATNWLFIPDFDDAPTYTCGNTVYGCWTATRLGANAAFVGGGGFGNDTVDVDYGFALVGAGGKANDQLDTTVGGGYGLKTTSTPLADQQWAFGYPAAGRYHGKDLTYCTNGTTSLIDDPYGANTWGMACDMTGGSSGGPWLYGTSDPASDTGKLVSSLNSYGYRGLTYMFGPKFDGDTSTVLGDVVDGSATNGVTSLH